jgi:hypothetical protein
MWGYLGEFVSLLRNIPAYRDVPLAELLEGGADGDLARRPRRRRGRLGRGHQSFIEEHRPQLRFHYRAIDHLLDQLLVEESSWDAFFEHTGIEPVLVLYENFAADYETSTLHLLERLNLACPDGFEFEPRMKRQSNRINDDWTKRYCDLRLGRDFDLDPVPVDESARRPGS